MHNAAYLNIISFVGMSPGAVHCYGHIWFNNNKYELKKKLSQEEANLLIRKI
jgi:hypothetical protein